jgi:hypothetical protein
MRNFYSGIAGGLDKFSRSMILGEGDAYEQELGRMGRADASRASAEHHRASASKIGVEEEAMRRVQALLGSDEHAVDTAAAATGVPRSRVGNYLSAQRGRKMKVIGPEGTDVEQDIAHDLTADEISRVGGYLASRLMGRSSTQKFGPEDEAKAVGELSKTGQRQRAGELAATDPTLASRLSRISSGGDIHEYQPIGSTGSTMQRVTGAVTTDPANPLVAGTTERLASIAERNRAAAERSRRPGPEARATAFERNVKFIADTMFKGDRAKAIEYYNTGKQKSRATFIAETAKKLQENNFKLRNNPGEARRLAAEMYDAAKEIPEPTRERFDELGDPRDDARD